MKWKDIELILAVIIIIVSIVGLFTPLFPVSLPVLYFAFRRIINGH